MPLTIYAVSDFSGETAERLARAAAGQFPDIEFNVIMVPAVNNKKRLERVIERAVIDKAVVFYTLVKPEFREFFFREINEAGVIALDVLGPALDAMDQATGEEPLLEPGPITKIDADYFHWIEAIQFTVKHDDGAELEDLGKADIVLIGVSRTGKTPLSIFIAYRGWKVANLPIVYGLPHPPELFKLNKDKIVGLTINPKELQVIRRRRINTMADITNGNYADPTYILKEIRYSQELMRRLKCRTIDVTGKAVEEIAQEIITEVPGLSEPLV